MPVNPQVFPVLPAAQGKLVISQANLVWGVRGAGSPNFFAEFGDLIYRDSTAKSAGPSPLQRKEGAWLLLANSSLNYEPKGRFEKRQHVESTSAILVGLGIPCDRQDADPQPLEIEPGEDPTGLIRQAIQEKFAQWGAHLPLIFWARLLTNGRIHKKYGLQTCYDGQALVSATHAICPTDNTKGNYPGGNLVQLAGAIDESGWTKAMTQLKRFPDVDGTTLPNAMAPKRPLVVCPSDTVAIRWAHFLGGKDVSKELIMQGQNAGISSVSVGRADIMVCDFLATQAEASADRQYTFDPEKRSYIFSRAGRKPFIFWEKKTPTIKTTGQDGHSAYEIQAEILYAYAYATMIAAEYRTMVGVDEP